MDNVCTKENQSENVRNTERKRLYGHLLYVGSQ